MQAKIKIEGMHCGSCAIDIKETLEEHAGVNKVAVSYDSKTAFVEFDENTIQSATIMKIIQDIGYQPSLTESSN